MAANIEQIFQDFILNKIREIEDQQEDNGPRLALASDTDVTARAAGPERDHKEEDGQGVALKTKHKKHKKHKSKKSKKRKKKRDRDEKESSSESGVESEGEAKHRSSRTPAEETGDGDGNRKAGRHKQHLMGKKKKKKKRRREDGRSSSESESESDGRGPGSSAARQQEDLPDIIPKQDSSKGGGADAERGGGRSHVSRSRSRSHSPRRARRSRSRSRPRGRRSGSRTRSRSRRRRTRSTSRSRHRRTRSTSRSRRRRTRSTSRARSPLGRRSRKTKSRSPRTRQSPGTRSGSEARGAGPAKQPQPSPDLPGIEPPVPDPVVDPAARTQGNPLMPSSDSTPPAAVAVKALGSWKPLPPLEVMASVSSTQKDGSTRSADGPADGLAGSDASPCPGEEGCSAAGEDRPHAEPQSAYRGADTAAQKREEDTGEASALQEDNLVPLPGPCDPKPTTVSPGATDPGFNAETPRLSKEPTPVASCTDGNDSKSSTKKQRTTSKSPQKKKEAKVSSSSSSSWKKSGRQRSRSNSRGHRRTSRSGSCSGRKRSSSRRKRSRSRRKRSTSRRKRSRSRSRKTSKSRSPARRSRRSRSRSGSRGQRRGAYGGGFSQRDRWKREPSRSPVLILRKNRSPAPKRCSESKSPSRITELDKEQLLEIAKANAAAMCTKAGVPIPDNLKPRLTAQLTLPLPMPLPNMAMNAAVASMTAATMTAALSSMGALASLPPLPSITNKPPPGLPQLNMAALEVVKKKVTKQANSISIKEFTDKCKMIVDSKGDLPVALPHVSDEEDEGKPFGSAALREQKAISFSINNMSVRPAGRSDAGIAKEFPVSSGSQHRKKEGEAPGVYGEWVPVEKTTEKAKAAVAAAAAAAMKAAASTQSATAASSPGETVAETQAPAGTPEVAAVLASDSVFPEPPLQPVDISQAVTERIKAQRRLAENPYDVSAITMLSRAQEQVDAWAQSNSIPGLFTGSTGATVLSSEELSSSGPQAWLKKVPRFAGHA